MAISQVQNGVANGDAVAAAPAELDVCAHTTAILPTCSLQTQASKLTVNLATQLKDVPPAAELKFGQVSSIPSSPR